MTFKWEDLRKQIADKQDFALYDEAVKCYKNNAFRMAYIAIWICIAESLRNKMSIMAQKDSVVDDIMKKIEECESKHQPPDRLILGKAKDLGIIDDSSYPQIEHILIMRNIYAHPYNTAPIPEEVKVAFINAINKVLSVPAFLRKPYIDNLLENLQQNRHFMDDVEEKVIKFAEEVTTKIAPNLYPYIFKGLTYQLNNVLGDPDKNIFQNRLIWFVRTFIKQSKPDFSNAKWRLKEKFNDFPKVVTKIFSEIYLWNMIPENIQDGVLGWMLYPEEEIDGKKTIITTSYESAKLVFSLYQNKKLTKRQGERFLEWIEKEEISNLGRWSIPLEYYVDRVIESLLSHNWYVQNPAAYCLWDLGESGMQNISSPKLEQLGRNILQSADGGARQSISFIKNMLTKNILWPKSFIKGLFYELFINENLNFRCKYRLLYDVLCVINYLYSEDIAELCNSLTDDIKNSTLKFGKDFDYGEEDAIEQLNKFISELDKESIIYKKWLLNLRQVIQNIKSKDKNI